MTYVVVLAAIADPTRRQIFERLRTGPQAVGRLAEGLEVTRPAVSQHLRVLEGAGLVRARREGTRRIYAVDIRGLQELRRYLDSFWGDVLAAFAAGDEMRDPSPPPPKPRRPARRPRKRSQRR